MLQDTLFPLNPRQFSCKQKLRLHQKLQQKTACSRKQSLIVVGVYIYVGFVYLSQQIRFDREMSVLLVVMTNEIIDSHLLAFCERQIKHDPFHATPRWSASSQ
jgi:hypothetical protein